jgi:hypothetical protein
MSRFRAVISVGYDLPFGCHGNFSDLLGKFPAPEGAHRKVGNLFYEGGVVQLVRTPACHAGDRGVRVPSLPPTLQDVHFSFERLQIARLASINDSSAMRLTPITSSALLRVARRR